MNRKKVNKTTKKIRRQNANNLSKASSDNLYRQAIMPLAIERKLNYVDSTTARNNPGGNFLITGIRINDLYDPDPAILTGSISGFKEILQFYKNFRADYCHIDVTISNQENFPLLWGLYFTQENILGSIPTAAAALNVLENGYTTGARQLSAKGGMDRDTQDIKIRLYDLVGNKELYEGSPSYTGTVSTSPAISLWCFLIVVSGTGASLNNGFVFNSKYCYTTKFFNRITLNA
jgi:hypothetical protein